MRVNLLFVILFILLSLAFIFVGDRAESLDITRIAEGTVKATNSNSIVIIDESNDKEAQIAIDSNTVYDNVQKLTDLKAGDKVQIDYKTNQNKNTAVTVTKLEIES